MAWIEVSKPIKCVTCGKSTRVAYQFPATKKLGKQCKDCSAARFAGYRAAANAKKSSPKPAANKAAPKKVPPKPRSGRVRSRKASAEERAGLGVMAQAKAASSHKRAQRKPSATVAA